MDLSFKKHRFLTAYVAALTVELTALSLSVYWVANDNSPHNIIITILLSGIVASVLVFVYLLKIHQRLWKLNEGILEFFKGDLSSRVQVDHYDGIGAVASTFNIMADKVGKSLSAASVYERELQEKNLKLSEAFIEIKQNSEAMVWAARLREEQNRKLEETVLTLEKTNRQLHETQAQLIQSDKMASIGQLAAGVAHEINNPVGFVNGNISTLEVYIRDIKELCDRHEEVLRAWKEQNAEKVTELEKEVIIFKEEKDIEFVFEDISKLISESKEGLARVKSIVLDLKNFSHPDEVKMKDFDIASGLESTCNIIWSDLKHIAEVRKEYNDIPKVRCHPQQINQVFMNILVNAGHAIGEKRATQPYTESGKGLISIRTYQEGTDVFVEIGDNGCGIPGDRMKRIFDPFFTTKEVGKGTGLGLSIAYNIIKKHEGDIIVRSTVGEGTTFTIKLPVDPDLLEIKQKQGDVCE